MNNINRDEIYYEETFHEKDSKKQKEAFNKKLLELICLLESNEKVQFTYRDLPPQ